MAKTDTSNRKYKFPGLPFPLASFELAHGLSSWGSGVPERTEYLPYLFSKYLHPTSVRVLANCEYWRFSKLVLWYVAGPEWFQLDLGNRRSLSYFWVSSILVVFGRA